MPTIQQVSIGQETMAIKTKSHSGKAIPDARGINLYHADPDAAALFAHYLPDPLFRHLEPTFAYLGALAGGRLDELATIADHNPPTLTVRRRIFPSGRPTEEVFAVERPDPTWEAEYQDFRELCAAGRTSLDRDMWINAVLRDLAEQRKETAWAA